MTASEEYERISQMLSGLTANLPIVAMAGVARMKAFEKIAKSDALMGEVVEELRKRLHAVGGPEDFTQMSQAYEAFAEANFVFEMLERGVKLERTSGTGTVNQKRPDFVHRHPAGNIYFEVKALDIADPLFRHKELAYRALEDAAELDERARKLGIHVSETVFSGFPPGMSPRERIDFVIERLNNTIKRDQLRYGPTILVVDLGRLPGMGFGASGLLPVFFHDAPPAESCVSGELWHIALGQIGERIFQLPEFDGQSNLSGNLTKQGVLHEFPSSSVSRLSYRGGLTLQNY